MWALPRPRRLRKLILWGRRGGTTLGGAPLCDGERVRSQRAGDQRCESGTRCLYPRPFFSVYARVFACASGAVAYCIELSLSLAATPTKAQGLRIGRGRTGIGVFQTRSH